ncbi:type IV secretion system DNA-binding domain-containing protein [Candidatus Peregrinibacteria bacterium]|nr:type IV secretion system DNA-binding domain-containing protein [Candidatus Peregrinibacteria bacterium]
MTDFSHLVITLSKLNLGELKIAENLLLALSGIEAKEKKVANFSFEIVAHLNFVSIFLTVPKRLKNFIQSQIMAAYPMIEVHEVKDFLESIGNRALYGGEMHQKDSFVFPLKTYVDFDLDELGKYYDTLTPILSAFSHIESPDDIIALQIAVNPSHSKVSKRGLKGITIAQGIYWALEKSFLNFYTSNKKIKLPAYLIWGLHGFGKGKEVIAGQRATRVSNSKDLSEGDGKKISASYKYSRAADKLVKKLFEVNIRILIATKKGKHHAEELYENISTSLQSMNDAQLGNLIPEKLSVLADISDFKQRKVDRGNILSSEELASFIHIPRGELEIPKLMWSNFRKIEPPSNISLTKAVLKIGKSNFQARKIEFGIREADILRHIYIIGRTGMGKSTLLENMIFDAMNAGKGMAIIDPHGDLAERALQFVPKKRINDVILFDPSDVDYPVAYNIMECKDAKDRNVLSSGIIGVFKKLYAESWGPRLEHILRNTVLTLLHCTDVSILAIPRILNDANFRKKCLKQVNDPILKDFWANEYETLSPKTRVEWISPILNKIGQFLSNPILRNILGQVKSKFHIRWAMDKGKILIVNLSKGKIGEDVSTLLGSVLISKFQIEAMSRADIPANERKDFYLFIDEFQNFATDSFASILSEARKYKLALIMANQYIAQMEETVRDAIFGNVGSLISFQVGYDDAEPLMKQFSEKVEETDLVSLSRGAVYLRLLIDGLPTAAFSASTSSPLQVVEDHEKTEKILKVSREKYAVKRKIIEEKIAKWSGE